jgi:hypothetical protein
MQTLIASGWIGLCLVASGFTFWHQDWRYGAPTPRPAELREPALGEPLSLPPALARLRHRDEAGRPTRPLLIHCFQVGCPCSRFQLRELRELVARHGERVDVVLLLQGGAEDAADLAAPEARLPLVLDPEGSIALGLGLYSTPTAALIDAESRLVYRGNYSDSRYCVDPALAHVARALEELLTGTAPSVSPPVPYGCPLPSAESAP